MSKHRAEVRPRYGRIAVLGSSVAVTLIAVLGGTGVLPSTAGDASARGPAGDVADTSSPTAETTPEVFTTNKPDTQALEPENNRLSAEEQAANEAEAARNDTTLPPDSGEGRRVIFSESRQRVWLVNAEEKVVRTYLVSGSIYDNLEPGTFEVYSRSEDATGIDDSGTMKYFVRFTQGDTGAAIGFHDIPVLDGERIQTFRELGTPLSHGCIRQRRRDAMALWTFAPLGTTVVVTA
ncbi:MAG: L,D-transpeptidase [Nocardioides sp.]|nr:L,D-transpeptidase [Nocardioides sp.]